MSEYKHMQMIVMFDLPVDSKPKRKAYTKFRDFLLDDGFVMLQFSVYSRFCKNKQDMTKHTARILANAPSEGNVRILTVTQKQFENMIFVIGTKTENEKTSLESKYTIVL